MAYFRAENDDDLIETSFDMLHVFPPQRAPECIRNSALCDEVGWLDVDQYTLQHSSYINVWGLGDVINAPNAKTLGAVRKQVSVVANNVINSLKGQSINSMYDGYGSCPLTVEKGKVILAEFIYGGKHSPTIPAWANDGSKATKFAWVLKKSILPWVYWRLMLKGHEWLSKPKRVSQKCS